MTIRVTLPSHQEVPVAVLPSDTVRAIHRKVTAVHGVPAQVWRKREWEPTRLLVRDKDGAWIFLRWDATFADLRDFQRDELKYSELYDHVDCGVGMPG